MRSTGASKGCLQIIVLWEGLILAGVALPAGLAFGLLLGFAFVRFGGIRPSLIPAHMLLALGASFIGIVIPSCLVRRTPPLQKVRKSKPRKEVKRERNIRTFSAAALFVSRIRGQKGVTAGLLVLLFSCGLVTALMMHLSAHYAKEIGRLQRLTAGSDLLLDNTGGLYGDYVQYMPGSGSVEESLPVTEEVLEKIRGIYGVQAWKSYQISNFENTVNFASANRAAPIKNTEIGMFTLDLSPYAESAYYQAYTLLVNERFFDGFSRYPNGSRYDCVTVAAGELANLNTRTDK